ncbi:kinase-like protein [Macrolepiota fuliginosa MF-IS2]|uniref:Kinase-like protein n=1 Tax=Macrolepiota fuliginosa MF-IS2 TaxID=1400762 RepID=A0A9P5XQC3_9AGAR|nr:kinase-like protein [Macrolepiota fuliginosa MF-IS2]
MGTQQSRAENPTSSRASSEVADWDAALGAGEQPDHKDKPRVISPTSSMNASTSSISLVTYQTGRTLSSGTHAIVKEAIHVRTGKHYACKILNKKLMEHREHMIRNEMAILRRISGGHCNVVTLHDHFETTRNLYLVFDLCTGGQLFERVCAQGNYDEIEAANLVRNTFKAVKYIHDSGVIHCNLKPQNLIFRTSAEDADIVITNFSLSKELGEEDSTMLTEVCGTTSFMAPEIFNGTGYGKAVDVWAMGVISYFLLAGYAPFNRGSEQEEIEAIITGDYNFEPQEYWATFSETAKDFIRTCLTIEPEKRPTATEALQHKWLASAHFVPGPDKVRIKKAFNAKQAWRKVAFSIIAVKRMSTLADQQRTAIQELRANLDKYREKSAEVYTWFYDNKAVTHLFL